jgi:hypothetical protein
MQASGVVAMQHSGVAGAARAQAECLRYIVRKSPSTIPSFSPEQLIPDRTVLLREAVKNRSRPCDATKLFFR